MMSRMMPISKIALVVLLFSEITIMFGALGSTATPLDVMVGYCATVLIAVYAVGRREAAGVVLLAPIGFVTLNLLGDSPIALTWSGALLRAGFLALLGAVLLYAMPRRLTHEYELRALASELELTNAELRTNEERLRALVSGAPVILFSIDREGTLTGIEGRGLSRLTSQPEAIVGRSAFEMFEGQPGAVSALRRALTGEMISGIATLRHAEFETQLVPLFDASNEVIGVIGVATDVSAHRQAERKLLALAGIVESTSDAIIGKTTDGIITSWNAGAERIFGYSAGEVVGRSISILLPPGAVDTIGAQIDRLHNGERIEDFETERIRKDGSRVYVALTISLTRDDAGQPLGASTIARDITERKRLEQQLIQAQKIEVIGRLAGGVAHDFNNLMTAIIGHAELATMQIHPDDRTYPSLQEICRTAERAAQLTRQLLIFSHRQVSMAESLNINDSVLHMRDMLRCLVGEHVKLVALPSPDTGNVRVDSGELEQVIANLVMNARDAMTDGGRIVIATENVHLQGAAAVDVAVSPGAYVMLTVTDDGVGMNADVKQHLFEPFFTTKDAGTGTGLGLATCYGIVTSAEGAITVESEAGEGTTVRVYLPCVAPMTPAQRARPALAPAAGHETILVVEDQDAVRRVVTQTLAEVGYTILEAANGADALRLVRERGEQRIDLLLTDIVMPRMGGAALASRVTEIMPDVPVVFMSGYTDDEAIRERVAAGDVRFIQKPFSPSVLASTVREALDQRVASSPAHVPDWLIA